MKIIVLRSAAMVILLFTIISCSKNTEKLPILGNSTITGKDTIYPKIKNFSFIDQDSTIVTNETFKDKIYITDFIFLSCPTICPRMTTQLSAVYKAYKDNASVYFLSHTIDPKNDSIPRLKAYATNLGVNTHWHFVTGNRDDIFKIATESYFATVYPDAKEPGGYVHSGGLLLVDKDRHIRGVYDGTNPAETKRLIADIQILLKEK
jgi:protein SCO1/2